MTPRQSIKYIKKNMSQRMSLEKAIQTFITFYESTSIWLCPKKDDADMLLFQCGGPYSWSPYVSINLTRQYTFEIFGRYFGMKQLSMDINYDPKLLKIDSNELWLEKGKISYFKDYILSSDQVNKAKKIQYENIEIDYFKV